MTRTCERCGREIAPARLIARPEATLCVRCKAKDDELPLRALDLGEALVVGSEITPGEAQRMTHQGGG